MWTKPILFLVGALSMCQVFSQDVYVAEVMVESNVTLTSESILASWNSSTSFTVNNIEVTISSSELVAECLVVGEEYSCNCSTGYAWSNDVCYNYSCCTDAPCLKNVSQASSICVERFDVTINGSVQLTSGSWTDLETTKLEKGLRMMNGVGSLNITAPSSSLQPLIAEFEMLVYVRLDLNKLQEILNGLTANLSSAPIYVDTKQMVHISVESTQVKYEYNINLNCTMKELTDSAGWNLSRPFERFSINKGSLTRISTDCVNEEYKSCVKLLVTKATGAWTGTYECGFTKGTIRNTASVPIKVVLLPDVITMTFSPMIADCSAGTPPSVTVTATIPKSDESYTYFWTYNSNKEEEQNGTNQQSFSFKPQLNCKHTGTQNVNITFKNKMDQTKSAQVEIPVFRETAIFCIEETLNNEKWLKTPGGVTLFSQACPPGRIGYKSRTCDMYGKWQEVFSKCISEELSKVTNAANNFLTGLGATQEVAKDIFEGVKNSSSLSSNGSADVADIGASIGIIGLMARASINIDLEEDLLPDLIDAASNMVSSNWSEVNDTIRQSMSADYLTNVEDLVKNIKINTSEGFNSTNLELKFCSSEDCSMSVFGIDVNLNKTNGTMKTMGVKNLMEKLQNFPGKNHSSILLSATLVGNNDSDIKIKMFFPDEQPTATERLCVFWNTSAKGWSSEGCIANITEDNQTLCECNHLTSFSVLMSKSGEFKDSLILDMITNIGLGVSVFCLLIFLFVESLVWSAVTKSNLSHFRHTAVVNIAVFRLLADCSFLASTDPEKLSDTLCFTFTVCKHLFYLAMFCWMLCLSVMLVHQLIFVFSPVRKRVFMYLSSILGYVVPIGLVGTSYVYYKYKEQDYYSRKTCWLTYVRLLEGSIHAFLLPVGTILLSNLFSMVVVIVTLVKTSVPDSSKSDDKETAKSILKVIVFLAPVFGVTWIIGFALLMLEKSSLHEVFEYAFVILNSFQDIIDSSDEDSGSDVSSLSHSFENFSKGLFILLTGCVGEQKVRQEVIRIIMVKTGRDTDSTKKLTNSSTTLYTKDK